MESGSASSGQPAAARARCSVCGAPAVARVPYARLSLCPKHFMEFVERKVRRVLERVGALRPGAKLLAAVSGGKDSAAMLQAVVRVAAPRGVRLAALHLDLGFDGYSSASRDAAVAACEKLGVPCVVVRVAEAAGLPVHELARRVRRPTCSVCGVVKRYLINAAAVEMGADYVLMGHNADDIIAYTVKEFLNQNLEAIAKLGPATESIPGLAAGRLRPLYEVYEREALLYAVVSGVPFLHDECPYRPRAPIEQRVKEFMNRLEEEHPGVKIGFIRRLEKRMDLYRSLVGDEKPGRCRVCGLPAAGEECSFCRITRRATGEPRGTLARSLIRAKLAEAGLLGGEG
ncbi:MAG: TIGR00269 family protein [Crenarchaeota archaeon]|nr:TIGR00269 family protein [Thermoproteota archaeon]